MKILCDLLFHIVVIRFIYQVLSVVLNEPNILCVSSYNDLIQ